MNNTNASSKHSYRMIGRTDATPDGLKTTHYIRVPYLGYLEYNRYLDYQKGVDFRIKGVRFLTPRNRAGARAV